MFLLIVIAITDDIIYFCFPDDVYVLCTRESYITMFISFRVSGVPYYLYLIYFILFLMLSLVTYMNRSSRFASFNLFSFIISQLCIMKSTMSHYNVVAALHVYKYNII